jgi:hypothetical protein
MTPFDDNDLIARLQSAIPEHQSDISAPEGFGDSARRAARRRTATRVVGAGVPVLAAAGVATVLATSSGSSATGGSRSNGSAPSAAVASGPVKTEDTAYIIKRVRARIAETDQGGIVIRTAIYSSGDVTGNGTLSNLRDKSYEVYAYTAPGGNEYARTLMYQEDGSPWLTMVNQFTPDGDGQGDDRETIINPRHDTYTQTQRSGASNPDAHEPTPDVSSSPAEVQHALQSGQVTKAGTATVDGAQAIALSVKVRSNPHTLSEKLTLYVDAHTYQPLRAVTTYDGFPGLEVDDWVPATPDTIAKAEDDSIPAGYTKVDSAG